MIISAALDLFASSYYESVTVRDVATACDINTALIYYYFGSKKGLFRAAIEASIREALAEYEKLREAADDPVELIEGWFDINIRNYRSLARMVKITVDYGYSKARDQDVDQLLHDLYQREVDQLAECIGAGVRGGAFRSVDPRAVALFVSVHLDGIFLASMIRPDTEIAVLVANLRDILWQQLGYRPVLAAVQRS